MGLKSGTRSEEGAENTGYRSKQCNGCKTMLTKSREEQ
jgi:hypothetical protein